MLIFRQMFDALGLTRVLAPPVVGIIPALIGAGASLGGAALGGKAAKKGTEAQLTGQREALAFQREQEAARRADFQRAQEQHKQAYDAWNAQRMALLKRYGVDIGQSAPQMGAGPAAPGPGGPGAVAPGPGGPGMAAPGPQVAQAVRGDNLGALIGGGGPPQGEWSDWRRYGLRA